MRSPTWVLVPLVPDWFFRLSAGSLAPSALGRIIPWLNSVGVKGHVDDTQRWDVMKHKRFVAVLALKCIKTRHHMQLLNTIN